MHSARRVTGVVLAAAVLAGCSLFAPPLLAPVPVDAAPFAPVVERYSGSVAKLLSSTCGGGPMAGSGFVVGSRPVLTAAHVVGGSRLVSLRLGEGAPFVAEVAGIDRARDVALLRTDEDLGVPAVALGETPVPGTEVVALGHPLGSADLQVTVARTTSLSDTALVNGYPMQHLVTVDATLPRGVSGGPVLDGAGAVRGMAIAVTSGRGGRDSVPTVTLVVPPAILATSLSEWRSAASPASACDGEEPGASGLPPVIEVSATAADAPDLGQTLWLLGASTNAGQFPSAWGLLTADEQARRGSPATWASTDGDTRWTALDVTSASRTADTATARVRLQTTDPSAGCRSREGEYAFRLVQGVWLLDGVTGEGEASAC